MKTPLSTIKINSNENNESFKTPIKEKKLIFENVTPSNKVITENQESPTFHQEVESPKDLVTDLDLETDNEICTPYFKKSNIKVLEIKESDSPIPDELFDVLPTMEGETRTPRKIVHKDTPLKYLKRKASNLLNMKKDPNNSSSKRIERKNSSKFNLFLQKKASNSSIGSNSSKSSVSTKSSKMVDSCEKNGLVKKLFKI
jgi:hypothetical protein